MIRFSHETNLMLFSVDQFDRKLAPSQAQCVQVYCDERKKTATQFLMSDIWSRTWCEIQQTPKTALRGNIRINDVKLLILNHSKS